MLRLLNQSFRVLRDAGLLEDGTSKSFVRYRRDDAEIDCKVL